MTRANALRWMMESSVPALNGTPIPYYANGSETQSFPWLRDCRPQFWICNPSGGAWSAMHLFSPNPTEQNTVRLVPKRNAAEKKLSGFTIITWSHAFRGQKSGWYQHFFLHSTQRNDKVYSDAKYGFLNAWKCPCAGHLQPAAQGRSFFIIFQRIFEKLNSRKLNYALAECILLSSFNSYLYF